MTNVSNILLLDEEEVLREATALLLVNRGANVTKAATIDDAVTHLERRTYDVVVVDIPEKHANPDEMLQRLVAKSSSSLRVIVCTEKPLRNAAPTGISHVLVKPYPFDDLVEAVFAPGPRFRYNTRQAVGLVTRRIATPRRNPNLVKRGRA
jgi:DNA-binding NtrC family response regulator